MYSLLQCQKIYIFFQDNIFLQGFRSASTTFLYKLKKCHNQYQEHEEVQSLNAVIYNPFIAERIKFYHAYLFFSKLHTLATSIDAGYLTKFPIIISWQFRKYPPRSVVTVKGRLKDIKNRFIYSQISSPSINNTTAKSASTPTIIEEYDSEYVQTPAPNP